MSKDLMAECLEEASECWSEHMCKDLNALTGQPAGGSGWVWDDGEDLGGFTATDKLVIATIAVALYQERMRNFSPCGDCGLAWNPGHVCTP